MKHDTHALNLVDNMLEVDRTSRKVDKSNSVAQAWLYSVVVHNLENIIY